MTERVELGADVTLYLGDCLEVLATLADNSVDAEYLEIARARIAWAQTQQPRLL